MKTKIKTQGYIITILILIGIIALVISVKFGNMFHVMLNVAGIMLALFLFREGLEAVWFSKEINNHDK